MHNSDDMPAQIRWIPDFISKIGFPILVSIAMWYLCYVTIEKNTKAIDDLKNVMAGVSQNLKLNTKALKG